MQAVCFETWQGSGESLLVGPQPPPWRESIIVSLHKLITFALLVVDVLFGHFHKHHVIILRVFAVLTAVRTGLLGFS